MTESNDPYRGVPSNAPGPVGGPPTAAPAGPVAQSQEVWSYPQVAPSAQSWAQSGVQTHTESGAGLLVTTTDRVDGKKISSYLGVVAGEVVLGTSISKDIKGSVRGFVGGRSSSYEKEIRYARQQATLEMVEVARQMRASAIVGVSFSYVTVNALVMVAATGTAVLLEDL